MEDHTLVFWHTLVYKCDIGFVYYKFTNNCYPRIPCRKHLIHMLPFVIICSVFTSSSTFGGAHWGRITFSTTLEGILKPRRTRLELFEHIGKRDAYHSALLDVVDQGSEWREEKENMWMWKCILRQGAIQMSITHWQAKFCPVPWSKHPGGRQSTSQDEAWRAGRSSALSAPENCWCSWVWRCGCWQGWEPWYGKLDTAASCSEDLQIKRTLTPTGTVKHTELQSRLLVVVVVVVWFKITIHVDTSPCFPDLFHSPTATCLNMLT